MYAGHVFGNQPLGKVNLSQAHWHMSCMRDFLCNGIVAFSFEEDACKLDFMLSLLFGF